MTHTSIYCPALHLQWKKGTAQAQKLFCARFWQLRQALGAFPQFAHSNILELLPLLQFTPLLLLLLHQAMHRELQGGWYPHQSKAKEDRKGKDKSEEQSKMPERWVKVEIRDIWEQGSQDKETQCTVPETEGLHREVQHVRAVPYYPLMRQGNTKLLSMNGCSPDMTCQAPCLQGEGWKQQVQWHTGHFDSFNTVASILLEKTVHHTSSYNYLYCVVNNYELSLLVSAWSSSMK